MPRATLISPQLPRSLTLSGEGLNLRPPQLDFPLFSPFFRRETLKRCPAAVSLDALIDSEVPDLRATRSVFLVDFYKPHPRQTSSIGFIEPQFEFVDAFCCYTQWPILWKPPVITDLHLFPSTQKTDRKTCQLHPSPFYPCLQRVPLHPPHLAVVHAAESALNLHRLHNHLSPQRLFRATLRPLLNSADSCTFSTVFLDYSPSKLSYLTQVL